MTKNSKCPVCPAHHNDIGNPESTIDPQELGATLEALDTVSQGPTEFMKACAEAGIKPIQNQIWKDLQFLKIYQLISLDALHHLYQGVIKHMIGWIQDICGDAEIDAHCHWLPPNHHIFMKGISGLLHVTGAEHNQICQFLLDIIIDIKLSDNLLHACHLAAI